MQAENLIPATKICIHHNIEVSFIHLLQEYGLIEVTSTEENVFITEGQLSELEKLIRLHFDLHINLEGLDAVMHLLGRINALEHELSTVKNRLRQYEGKSRGNVFSE